MGEEEGEKRERRVDSGRRRKDGERRESRMERQTAKRRRRSRRAQSQKDQRVPSRAIRLYQYDEEGQPFVPQPGPGEPGPAPWLHQRSVSLTRRSSITAAASAAPLEPKDTQRADSSSFHMEI